MTRPFNWRSESGMQVLYLGEVPIGRVDVSGVKAGLSHRWLFHLAGETPGTAAFWQVAAGETAAKAALLEAANTWLNRAGWV